MKTIIGVWTTITWNNNKCHSEPFKCSPTLISRLPSGFTPLFWRKKNCTNIHKCTKSDIPNTSCLSLVGKWTIPSMRGIISSLKKSKNTPLYFKSTTISNPLLRTNFWTTKLNNNNIPIHINSNTYISNNNNTLKISQYCDRGNSRLMKTTWKMPYLKLLLDKSRCSSIQKTLKARLIMNRVLKKKTQALLINIRVQNLHSEKARKTNMLQKWSPFYLWATGFKLKFMNRTLLIRFYNVCERYFRT